jgi:hypothetical protein
MENAYPKLRGIIIPEDWFDEALAIVRDMRDNNQHP